MYLAALRNARDRARDERGFTLVELLMALAAGMVVVTATMALLITSLHLTSNYTDRVDANQQGRDALQRITQALNSSCISPSVTPVLAGSTSTSLSFYSTQTDTPSVTPNMITITENGTTTTPGSLVLKTQPMTGSINNWSATGTATNYVLLPYSLAPSVSSTQNSSVTTSGAVFTYYGYASDDTPTTLITPGSSGLTSSQASQVVMVVINFEALPSDNWNAGNRGADFSDSVVLRLTPASSATGVSNSPCS